MNGDHVVLLAAVHNRCVPGEIRGPRQSGRPMRARKQVYLVLRESGWSYPQIGKVVGRDHTSVLSGIETAERDEWMEGLHVPPPRKTGRMKPRKLCKVDGCDFPARSRRMCSVHYERWRKHGTTELPDPERNDRCEVCGEPPLDGGRWCLAHFQAYCDERRKSRSEHARRMGIKSTNKRYGRVA